MEIMIVTLVILALAVVPMLLYALVLWWFDRYEKEPLGLIVAAFLWGAIPAVIFSLIAQLLLDIPISLLVEPGLGADLLGVSLIAPATEEPFKGLALLLLMLLFRREIDSPLDGILYGGLVGFGFATTENLFYFFDAYGLEGLGGMLELTFFRVLLFGLNHALFTGCTGLGIALARTSSRWWVTIGAPILGLAAGMTLHAVHNTGTAMAGTFCWPLLVSLVADWGGVGALFVVILWVSARERAWITHYLADEIRVGSISQRDYQVVRSYGKRVGQRLQALAQGDLARWWRLGRYYRLATKLAFVKRRQAAFGSEAGVGTRIERLRRELHELRKQL
ncbi:MAG TPA: PrsW family intramembrane metalloprotease [Chloroflexi bacterium]|nr:PrsW family intramembrane metalloprotease [Chloroflexota bacterium]